MAKNVKEVVWMGSSKRDLREFPDGVRQVFGIAIFFAQKGAKHPNSTPMKGHKGAGVLEVIEDFDSDTYRCVYTVKFGDKVYVLHAFKKKSKTGISTPQPDIEVINKRLADAKRLEGL